MSKVILTPTKNGASNIDKSRQATNLSNLKEDCKDWQKIVFGDEKNKIIPTIKSRLEKNYEYYGFNSKDDINFKAVQRCPLNDKLPDIHSETVKSILASAKIIAGFLASNPKIKRNRFLFGCKS